MVYRSARQSPRSACARSRDAPQLGRMRSAIGILATVGVALAACGPADLPLEGGQRHLPADGFTGSGASGGSGAAGGGGSGSGAGGGGGSEIPPLVCSFAEEVAYALPSGFGTDGLDDLSKDTGGVCLEGELSYGLRDLTGDLRPDLVVADDCDLDGIGTGSWRVYPAEANGFGAAIDWALPVGFGVDALDDLAKDSGGACFESEISYGLVDMNGDERPDLVVADACDFEGVGTTHWLVYENHGDGFAAIAQSWALPPAYTFDDLDDLAADDAGGCAVGELSFGLEDMDGDLRPDLVVSDACDLEGTGSDDWLVYRNEGDGFASAAIGWALPSGFGFDALDDLEKDDGGLCALGELSYGLRDMDGDLRPDLVVTDDCDDGAAGDVYWAVFHNDGDRFASVSVSWALPIGFGYEQLDDLSADESASCIGGELSYATLDANGDRTADLLVSDRCDVEGTGTTHWTLVASTGTELAPAGAWLLPAETAGFSFDQLDDLAKDTGTVCAGGELSYAAVDLDGDRVLDLVVSDDCDDAEVGSTHWRVFRGSCAR
jgi:hypothetical protein